MLLLIGAVGAGCDGEGGSLLPNQAPNTQVSAGPPEALDTGFAVELFWFGWDQDGFVDHYEISWESPDNWEGPIYTNDSLFTLSAAEVCCVEPLPGTGSPQDSVYEEYHTFYVRAVDNEGTVDPYPAVRSFNSKTVAPYTEISYGPGQNASWPQRLDFQWEGNDDDGVVEYYRYALLLFSYYAMDGGVENPSMGQVLAWVDTLTFFPDPAGGYTENLVWQETEVDTVTFTDVPVGQYLFAVRAVDNAGAVEKVLTSPANGRIFNISEFVSGPNLSLTSNSAGSWRSGNQTTSREIFGAEGVRFRWLGTQRPNTLPVAGYTYSVEDSLDWEPYSITRTSFPETAPGEPEVFWYPDEGVHSFWVRAVDRGGATTTLEARFEVFDGPRFVPSAERFVLIVLDTVPLQTGEADAAWPWFYPDMERAWIESMFTGVNYRVWETEGSEPPSVSLMNNASSTFWFHGGDIFSGDDQTVLSRYFLDLPNVLSSYLGSGGNLFICGHTPTQAMIFFEKLETGFETAPQEYPVQFITTVTDTTYVPHFAYTRLGIEMVQSSQTSAHIDEESGMRVARSLITEGVNPYPDLHFDPLSWTHGPNVRAFSYFDQGLILRMDVSDGVLEPIYAKDDTQDAVGLRWLKGPGLNGNAVFLALHPYFVDRGAFRDFLVAVLDDFGETHP
jgi:hypothetical protein